MSVRVYAPTGVDLNVWHVVISCQDCPRISGRFVRQVIDGGQAASAAFALWERDGWQIEPSRCRRCSRPSMTGRVGGRGLGLAGAAGRSPLAVELLEVLTADQPVAAVLLGRQLLGIHVAPQRRSRHAELFRGYGDRKQLVTSLHTGYGTKPATVRIGYHGLAGKHPISYNPDTTVTGYGG